jgi:transcription termination factor NusB
MVFAKLKNFFVELIFSKIPKKKIWREKINLAKTFFNLAKKVGPFLIKLLDFS